LTEEKYTINRYKREELAEQ
jgi:hypothetical protein